MLRNVTDEFFRHILGQMTIFLQEAYILKTHNDKEHDKYRNIVIDLFKEKISIKKADVRDAVMKKLGVEIHQNVYLKIVKELAYPQSTSWVFKSGHGKDG